MSTIDDSKEINYLKDVYKITPKSKPVEGETLLPTPTKQMLQLLFEQKNLQGAASPNSLRNTPDHNDFPQSETSSGIRSLMDLEVAPTADMQKKINSKYACWI